MSYGFANLLCDHFPPHEWTSFDNCNWGLCMWLVLAYCCRKEVGSYKSQGGGTIKARKLDYTNQTILVTFYLV
jgi:hypothetical protein